jgi:uncharacterized LabA/DUF88 family protein
MSRIIYAFIDSQNLNLGVKELGWSLDYKKFFIFLKDKFKVEKAFIFIGYIESNKSLYRHLEYSGYTLVYKPTVKGYRGKHKGNVDAELVLHSAKIEYCNYDHAILVTGDGDFKCLIDELEKCDKFYKLIIPNRQRESSLLSSYGKYKIYVEKLRPKVERL